MSYSVTPSFLGYKNRKKILGCGGHEHNHVGSGGGLPWVMSGASLVLGEFAMSMMFPPKDEKERMDPLTHSDSAAGCLKKQTILGIDVVRDANSIGKHNCIVTMRLFDLMAI